MDSTLGRLAAVAILLILAAFSVRFSNGSGWEPYLWLGLIFLWLVITILLGRTFEISFVSAGIISLICVLSIIGIFSFELFKKIVLWLLIAASGIIVIIIFGDKYV